MLVLATYLAYIVISVAMTTWVAGTLHKNGHVFLVDAFHGKEGLARSINHLLVVGFCLINLGAVCLFLKMSSPPTTAAESVEALSVKLGMVLLFLGAFHFFNVYLFSRYRARAMTEKCMFPTAPQSSVHG